MKKYKVRYGASVLVRDMHDGTTIGELKRDQSFRAYLGYGDNVNALFQGAALPDEALAPVFDEMAAMGRDPYWGAVVMETACNKKECR